MNLAKKSLIFSMLLPVMLLGGCGYDLEINMPGGQYVNDALGIGKKNIEPQLRDRGPLVAPPKGASLPVPVSSGTGSSQIAETNKQWPVDPDVQAERIRAAQAEKNKNKVSEEERLRQMAVNNEDPNQTRLFQDQKVSDKYRKEASDEDSGLPSN